MASKHVSTVRKLIANHPQAWTSFQDYITAVEQTGPLDARSQSLVKVALAASGRSEGSFHFHVRRALEEGLSADELRHVALLAAPILGFATAAEALRWIDDLLD
jgi:alkylhydroperoxidase/carboxymuconolactone decarboxylase family protein YurZ